MKIPNHGNGRPNATYYFDGRSQTIREWAKEFGINRVTLYSRLRLGWPVDEKFFSKASRQRSNP